MYVENMPKHCLRQSFKLIIVAYNVIDCVRTADPNYGYMALHFLCDSAPETE